MPYTFFQTLHSGCRAVKLLITQPVQIGFTLTGARHSAAHRGLDSWGMGRSCMSSRCRNQCGSESTNGRVTSQSEAWEVPHKTQMEFLEAESSSTGTCTHTHTHTAAAGGHSHQILSFFLSFIFLPGHISLISLSAH